MSSPSNAQSLPRRAVVCACAFCGSVASVCLCSIGNDAKEFFGGFESLLAGNTAGALGGDLAHRIKDFSVFADDRNLFAWHGFTTRH